MGLAMDSGAILVIAAGDVGVLNAASRLAKKITATIDAVESDRFVSIITARNKERSAN